MERARVLQIRKFRDSLIKRSEVFEKTIVQECGKTPAEVWMMELMGIGDLASYWIRTGPSLLSSRRPELPWVYHPKRVEVSIVPRGTIGLLTPWNFPLIIPLRTMFPALLAGNRVLFKPSEFTPQTGRLIVEAADEAFGHGVVQLVEGGSEAGQKVIDQADAVVFTGSETTGRHVARACAERLIPCALQLGGKDAAIVLDDAPLERTASGIVWAALANMGQHCASIERVYATPSIAHPLFDAIAMRVAQLAPGRDLGRMHSEAQAQRVRQHIEQAELAGAWIKESSLDPPPLSDQSRGLWVRPVLIGGADRSMVIVQDETFGPAIPIVEVREIDEAIVDINTHRYGLTASIWTKNLHRAEAIAKKLDVGVVTINDHALTAAVPSLPWSGSRASGYGTTNGPECLSVMTKTKVLWIDSGHSKSQMWWFPYRAWCMKLARMLTVLARGDLSLRRRVRAIYKVWF